MIGWVVLALVIVAVLYIIYSLDRDSDRRRRQRAAAHRAKSCGTFDEHAKAELAELSAIQDKTAEDYVNRGRIYRFNVLEGNLAQDPWIAEAATDDYAAAARIVRADTTAPATDTADDALLWAIRDFERAAGQRMLHQDAPVEAARAQHDAVAAGLPGGAPAAAVAHEALQQTAHKWTDDRQSVHDPKINSDLRLVLSIVRRDGSPRGASAADIEQWAARHVKNPEKLAAVRRVLGKMQGNEWISTYGAGEADILGAMWARADHPKNAPVRDDARAAVVEALADCEERGNLVCINGRCARILNSLATIDYDPIVAAGALTFEAYRNQLFDEVDKAIAAEIDSLQREAPSPQLRAAAEAFAGGGFADKEGEALLGKHLGARIDRVVDRYADKFTPDEAVTLRDECRALAGIDL